MLKFASLFAFCAALFGATTLAAIAGPRDRSVMPQGSYQEARNWGDIVCCKSGGQASFRAFGLCTRHFDGVVVNNAQCRHDANTNADTNWRDSGESDASNRVCCAKGGRDWWSTARECRVQGGDVTNARRCSNG
jgi:hypothetical protein